MVISGHRFIERQRSSASLDATANFIFALIMKSKISL